MRSASHSKRTICSRPFVSVRYAVEHEVDRERTLLPLLEIAHDAAPRARSLDREGTFVIGRIVGLEAKDLDAGARRLVHDDAGADDLCVVEDQQRPFGQLFAQSAEAAFADRAVAVDEQFRGRAFAEREFRYALVGQFVVEFVDIDMAFHVRVVYTCKITIKSAPTGNPTGFSRKKIGRIPKRVPFRPETGAESPENRYICRYIILIIP